MCLETCVGSEKKKEREVRRERLKNGGGGGGGVGGGRERRKREVRMNNNCTQVESNDMISFYSCKITYFCKLLNFTFLAHCN